MIQATVRHHLTRDDAQLVARLIARDSGSIDSAIPGVLIDFRFRRVACERVYDWQLQVTTPKARTP